MGEEPICVLLGPVSNGLKGSSHMTTHDKPLSCCVVWCRVLSCVNDTGWEPRREGRTLLLHVLATLPPRPRPAEGARQLPRMTSTHAYSTPHTSPFLQDGSR